jgi:hypothetical protein
MCTAAAALLRIVDVCVVIVQLVVLTLEKMWAITEPR